jgi:hypothetical protein
MQMTAPMQPSGEDAHLEAAYETSVSGYIDTAEDYDEANELDNTPYWFGDWEDF